MRFKLFDFYLHGFEDCGQPRNISHGTIQTDVTAFQSKATFTCFDGYVINEGKNKTTTIECQKDGHWSNIDLLCEAIGISNII